MAERIMRLGKRREELVQKARGDVLEVSCGTGRNMDFYLLGEKRGIDKNGKAEIQGCRSVTFVDQSGEMVKIARLKFEKKHPTFKRVAFRTQDAMDPIPPPPLHHPLEGTRTISTTMATAETKNHRYDTIVQTMGLCSHPDPVSFLIHLGTLAKPGNGQILLLEHGRSHYAWLNRILDDLAPAHADRHGCWWNRDIGEVVRQSGLVVVESKRWHLGTTWRFVLRPKREQDEEDGQKRLREKAR
jgi:methyltransferase OMS1